MWSPNVVLEKSGFKYKLVAYIS